MGFVSKREKLRKLTFNLKKGDLTCLQELKKKNH
jgi:hypothetical protein